LADLKRVGQGRMATKSQRKGQKGERAPRKKKKLDERVIGGEKGEKTGVERTREKQDCT